MNQLKNVLTSLFQPLTEPEVYTNLVTKLAMIIIYILVGLIVIGIINKAIEEAFKFCDEELAKYDDEDDE